MFCFRGASDVAVDANSWWIAQKWPNLLQLTKLFVKLYWLLSVQDTVRLDKWEDYWNCQVSRLGRGGSGRRDACRQIDYGLKISVVTFSAG